MHPILILIALAMAVATIGSCKKDKEITDCFPNAPTIRQISNKQAIIKLTATANPVYIIEQGSVDTKLIPCNFPMEFYQNDLRVVISGDVKPTPQGAAGPCCTESLVITKITRL